MGEIMHDNEAEQGFGGGHDFGSSRDDQGDWSVTWRRFFESVKTITDYKIDQSYAGENTYATDLQKICHEIVESLTAEEVIQEVPDVVDQTIREIGDQGQFVMELLQREIIAITNRNLRLASGVSAAAEESFPLLETSDAADEAIEDTKTGKDSLEKFFGKKFTRNPFVGPVLTVLNEILSLMKGGF